MVEEDIKEDQHVLGAIFCLVIGNDPHRALEFGGWFRPRRLLNS